MSAYAIPVGLPRRRRIVSPAEWLREEIAERRRAREETMVEAAVTHGVSTFDTTNASPWATGSFTPAANDLLVAFVVCSATTETSESLTDSQGLGWTSIFGLPFTGSGSTIRLLAFVANNLAAASAMTVTFSMTGTSPTGAWIIVERIAGMSKTGAAAVRQSAKLGAGTAGTTPAPAFPAAALTTNPCLGAIQNATSPAGLTPPAGWTEQVDSAYLTPTVGGECATRDSGFTGTTVSWGSTSASAFGAMIVELDASAPPKSLVLASRMSRLTHLRR